MAKFTVKPKNAVSAIDVENNIASELSGFESEIRSISNSLGFKIAAEYNLKNRLKNAADKVGDYHNGISDMSSALQNILDAYESTEGMLLGVGDVIENSNVYSDVTVTNDKEEMSYQDALDFLNDISMSTSIDGAVLTIIDYMLDLLEMQNIGGGISDAVGITGLVTSWAADVFYGLDHGISRNALIADMLVDAGLFLVGECLPLIGEAIGGAATLEAGGVGAIVGKFVGGIVGNGISIAMNVDWNGDKEGGVGKDALTDWIDSMLDKVWEDEEFAAEI